MGPPEGHDQRIVLSTPWSWSGTVALPDVDGKVSVAVDGPGRLQGRAAGDPRPEDPFTTADVTMTCAGAGSITVTVGADGCAPATIRVEAESESGVGGR